jgi:DNA mismatch endonuclease, patch repair protein
MSKIKSKHTAPEILIRRMLWAVGLRYRVHDKKLPGTPDIVFKSKKKVIFVNGCFWHGHDCQKHGMNIGIRNLSGISNETRKTSAN